MGEQKEGKVISFAAYKGQQDAEKTLKSQMALNPQKERKTSSLVGFKRKQKREKKASERRLRFKLFFQNMCDCHVSRMKLRFGFGVLALLAVSIPCAVLVGVPWFFYIGISVATVLTFRYILYLLVKSGREQFSHRSDCHHYVSTPPRPLRSA